MIDAKRIEDSSECYKCGSYVRWRAEVSNSKPVGVSGVFTADRSEAEVVFVGKNKIEVIARCKKCYNKNRFLVEL
ncbi:hypothetical protein [Peribacillus butanolivorans]|uniref:hypothetical protein n=1 Tax=Peribacillus butanolivorans TaxID=421767 RepID=UPI00367EC2DF